MSHAILVARAASLLLDAGLRSLALFIVTGVACLVLRRASAASRHALWLLTLAALLCLPILSLVLPSWSVRILPLPPKARAALPNAFSVEVGAMEVSRSTPPKAMRKHGDAVRSNVAGPVALPSSWHAPASVPTPAPISSNPLTTIALTASVLAWLAGVLVVLMRTGRALVAARHLARRCKPVTTGPLAEAAAAAQKALNVTRPLSVLEGREVGVIPVPMTMGVLRPTVLLPYGATNWSEDRLEAVLLHETAHVRRLDWAAMVLGRIVCAFYWCHPLVWLAADRLREESEEACDDVVLGCGVAAPEYAAHLLEIIQMLSPRVAPASATVAMAHRGEVSDRLRAILAQSKKRNAVRGRALAVAALASLGAVAAVAAVHPVASSHAKSHAHSPAKSHTLNKEGHRAGDVLPMAAKRLFLMRVAAWRHLSSEVAAQAPSHPAHILAAPKRSGQEDPAAKAEFLAGLTAVQGPGVVVTLSDSRKKLPNISGLAPATLIHDTDITQVVNELRVAGAEAIAVNGQRLVATTAIRVSGATVFVNEIPEASPFAIRAIGNPVAMQARLNLPGGVAEQIRRFDPAMIRVTTAARITLPAYHGRVRTRYARPLAASGPRPTSMQAASPGSQQEIRIATVAAAGAAIRSRPDQTSALISVLKKGQRVAVQGGAGNYYTVPRIMIGNHTGYITKASVRLPSFQAPRVPRTPQSREEIFGQRVVNAALGYLGLPWQGRSATPGVRSSASAHDFVQDVYAKNGEALSDDLKAQAARGHLVSPTASAGWLPGDRFYFALTARELNHAAIYLGQGLFVHPSPDGDHTIRIDALDAHDRKYLKVVRRG